MKRNWRIFLKHPMWRGWKRVFIMYGFTREQAESEAKLAVHYYEGATDWKVK